MTAVVTGGAGFVGGHLVALLVERGFPVRVIEKPGVAVDHLPTSKIDIVLADVRDPAAVRAAVAGASHVFHLAANPQLWTAKRGQFHQVNYWGTVHVLESAFAAGASCIVHCSTESILTRSRQCGPIGENQTISLNDVIGPYCRSKWRAERHAFRLAKAGAPVVVANPTLPVGPGDRGLSPPTRMILDCALGKRSAYLDADLNLIDVRDVALGLAQAAELGRPGRRYLLGAENWSIHRLFCWIANHVGVAQPKWQVPYGVALAAACIDELIADIWTKKPPAASVTGVKLTRRVMQFDAERSLEALGIKPNSVESALTEAVSWLKSRPQSWAKS